MRMSEFDRLMDELAAYARKRTMAKAMSAVTVVEMPRERLHAPSFAAMARELSAMNKATSSARPFQRPDEIRVQQQWERIGRARQMLKSMVADGRITAIDTAKVEMRLNRYAAGLPL